MKEPIINLDEPGMGYKKVIWDGAYFLNNCSPTPPALSGMRYTEVDLQEAIEYLNQGFAPAMYISHCMQEVYVCDECLLIDYYYGWGGLSCRLDDWS